MSLLKRAKLLVFLRENRHEIFDEPFQRWSFPKSTTRALFGTASSSTGEAGPRHRPAGLHRRLRRRGDGVMDRRWQLVLDCLGAEEPPFSKWSLVNFRKRLIERDLDRRLIERTVEVAKERGGFSNRRLRAALDSSPLWGAGRVEDTYNLLGDAL